MCMAVASWRAKDNPEANIIATTHMPPAVLLVPVGGGGAVVAAGLRTPSGIRDAEELHGHIEPFQRRDAVAESATSQRKLGPRHRLRHRRRVVTAVSQAAAAVAGPAVTPAGPAEAAARAAPDVRRRPAVGHGNF